LPTYPTNKQSYTTLKHTAVEEIIDNQTPTTKIYKEKAIYVGTMLGGPLAAGYLIAENFKAFNEINKAKKTWIFAIIATIIIFGGVFMIPENSKIPNQMIPLIYTGIAYYLVQHFQGQQIAAHNNLGGQLFSWWRTILVGIIGLTITVIPIFGFYFLSNKIDSASISTKTFGIKKHEISFDKSNISEREVDNIANGLTKTFFFDDAQQKITCVKKVGNTYEVTIPIIDGISTDNQAMQPFFGLRTDLQTLFPNNKIVLNLVEDNFDNVVKRIE